MTPLKKTFRIKSRVAPEFMWGNLLFLYYCPVGYIIDATSRQKIYTYDNSILIDLNSKKGYKKLRPSNKGQFYFRGSLPLFDFIELDKGQGTQNLKSYGGLTVGLDYYYSPHSFLSLSGGATGISDIALPVMDRFNRGDTTELAEAYCTRLTNNHDFNIFSSNRIKFTVGYGLGFTNFRYTKSFTDSVTNQTINLQKSNKSAISLCLNASVILFQYGFIGISVLPSIYTLTTKVWEYNALYLAYIDFGVRVPLRNYNNDKYRVIKYKPKPIE